VKRFEVTFSLRRTAGAGGTERVQFFFNATNYDDFDKIRITHSDTKTGPTCSQVQEGSGDQNVTATTTDANMPTLTSTSVLWSRIENTGTTVTVKCLAGSSAPSDTDWSGASVCFTSSNFSNTGGMIGFNPNLGTVQVDDVTVKADRGRRGSGIELRNP